MNEPEHKKQADPAAVEESTPEADADSAPPPPEEETSPKQESPPESDPKPAETTDVADTKTDASDEAKDESGSKDESADEGDKTDGEKDAEVKEFNWGDGLDLSISNDKLTAWLTVDVDYAPHYTAQSLAHYLDENKITYGIDKAMLESILKKHLYNERQVVAKGTPAEHGKDGYIEWDIDLSILDGAQLVERGGRVNHKERHRVLQLDEGQRMAVLFEPTEGTDGTNLMGETLAAKPGKPAKFPAGKNTTISDDGSELFSGTKGILCKDGEKYSVSTVYEVQGDVNYGVGNIDFDHSVVISGGVLVDFIVKSGQDIHVNGLVEGAHLEALGSIYINGGIQGDEKATIKAGAEIHVKFVNGATLTAESDVTISGPVTNSTLESRGTITLEGNKGILMGGKTHAEKGISVEVIGSESEVRTDLMVGPDLTSMTETRKQEHEKLDTLLQNYKKIQQAVQAFDQAVQAGKQLKPEQTQMRLKLIRAGLQVQGQVKTVKEKIKQVDAEMKARSENVHGVTARDKAYPGTHIIILGHTHIVRALTTRAQFNVIDKEIEVFAIKSEEKKK